MIRFLLPMLVIALLGFSSSCAKKVSSEKAKPEQSAESIVVQIPKTWQIIDQTKPNGSTSIHLVPQGQNINNWRDIFVVKSYPVDSIVDPQEQLELTKKGFEKSCIEYKASKTSSSIENYYRVATVDITCKQFKKRKNGEFVIFKSFQGQDAFFVAYKSWKLDKNRQEESISKSEIKNWRKTLGSIKLCDDINPKMSCPKTNSEYKKIPRFILN